MACSRPHIYRHQHTHCSWPYRGRRRRQPACWVRLAEHRQALAPNTPGAAAGTHYLTRRLALPAHVKTLLRNCAEAGLRHEPRHLSPSNKGSQHCSFHSLLAKGMQEGGDCAAECCWTKAEVARLNMITAGGSCTCSQMHIHPERMAAAQSCLDSLAMGPHLSEVLCRHVAARVVVKGRPPRGTPKTLGSRQSQACQLPAAPCHYDEGRWRDAAMHNGSRGMQELDGICYLQSFAA